MKKHNEGYTLPLVMVVLLVLAIVAVTIMTTSMNNMLRQQEFIETMEDQYAAQGEIEKIVAQLERLDTGTVNIPLSNPTLSKSEDGKTDVLSGTTSAQYGGGENVLCTVAISAEEINKVVSEESGEANHYTIPSVSTVTMKSECGTVTIQCEMKLSLLTGGNEITYTSYEIIKGGGT